MGVPAPKTGKPTDTEVILALTGSKSDARVDAIVDELSGKTRDEKIPHPSGDDGGDGLAWVVEPDEILTGTHCVVDGVEIKMIAFKGTGICSEYCRKVHAGEITPNGPSS